MSKAEGLSFGDHFRIFYNNSRAVGSVSGKNYISKGSGLNYGKSLFL